MTQYLKMQYLKKQNWFLIAIIVLGLAQYLFRLDYQSAWLDEIHSMNEANPQLTITEVFKTIMEGEQIPPLYFYCLHFLFKIFGYSILVARLFSVILGALTLYSIFLLGKELYNQRVGHIAALLLCFNYFHLHFAQEARPYIFLEIFTIMSFFSLTRFLKNPTFRNSIWYGIFVALMVYGHFFGLLVLFSQYLIILFYLIFLNTTERLNTFKVSIVSGIFSFILLIPAVPMFVKALQIKEFWIPSPQADAYYQILADFFGNSETILFFIYLFFILYMVKLVSQKNLALDCSIIKEKFLGSFLILMPWLSIVLIIPLLKSHISTSIILNRYFIVILPAIIIVVAIGIAQVRNNIVRNSLITVFVIFSIINTHAIKRHYYEPHKTQFREATTFIQDNHNGKDPVVTSLGWYMPFFFKDNEEGVTIIEKTLEEYMAESLQNKDVKAFWYIDAHNRPFNLSDKGLKMLSENYYIQNNYDGFDIWTKHIIPISQISKTIDLSKYKKMTGTNGDIFKYNLESYTFTSGIQASGWAYFENEDSKESKIEIVAIKESIAYRLQTEKVVRNDVSKAFSDNRLNNTGFKTQDLLKSLSPGQYSIGIYLTNKRAGKEGLVVTDNIITIN